MLGLPAQAAPSVDQSGARGPGACPGGTGETALGGGRRVAGFDFAAGRWMFREEELVQFVWWTLHGQVVPVASLPRYRRVYRAVKGEQRQFRRGQRWTSAQSAEAQQKHNAMRERQELVREEREARKKELAAEAERQRQLVEEQERARRAEESRIH